MLSIPDYFKMMTHLSWQGRASIREYRVVWISCIILLFLSWLLHWAAFVICGIYIFILGYCVFIRRAHDLAGQNVNVYYRGDRDKLSSVDSDPGVNQYGPEPADSKRNLRILRNQKEVAKLAVLPPVPKEQLHELNRIFDRLYSNFEDRISLDLLLYIEDRRIIWHESKTTLTAGDFCLSVLVRQLLPPDFYWEKSLFTTPEREGADRQLHRRPFCWQNRFGQFIFTVPEFRLWLEQNQNLPLAEQRITILQKIADDETAIGFTDAQSKNTILNELKRLIQIAPLTV